MTGIGTVRGIGVALFYLYIFWNMFKTNPGNKVIRCGSITLMVFVVMIALTKVPNFPVWYLARISHQG
jgi:hypothetical protein